MDPVQKRKRQKLLPKVLVRGFVLCLGVYLVVQLVLNQITISAKRQQLAELREQLDTQQAQNAELARVLESDNELELIERVARDSLGYAKPNERVFVDMSGK